MPLTYSNPTVGGDSGTWGTKLNNILDAIKALVNTNETTANAAMPKSGGVFTDEIEVHSDKFEIEAPTVGATTTIDLAEGRFFHFEVTEATTIAFSNVPATGKAVFIVLEITNGDAFTLTWPASVAWPAGAAPSLVASGVDVVSLYTRDGGTTWRAALSQSDSS